MNITEHFDLQEFIRSETAARRGIDNTPNEQILANIKRVAERMEDVRKLLGFSIHITSGYRCSALNKLIGSKPTSRHVQGLACDFVCPEFGNPREIVEKLRDSDVMFDRVILEHFNPNTGDGWVHLDLGSETRHQVFTINSYGFFTGVYT
jgi:uncharacterized protein YcbK (DUF882 family)